MDNKKTNRSIFNYSPILPIEPESNQKHVSDIDALLNEPIPEDDCEPNQLTSFVKRQYEGYLKVGRQCSAFQYRMGSVLIRERQIHKPWEEYVRKTYEFSPRTALNYMKTAQLATEEEALRTPPTELYQNKGIIPYRKDSKPPTNDVDDGQDKEPEDDGMIDLETLGNVVKKVTNNARALAEKVQSLPPDSYHSPEKHGAFLKGFATEIEGAMRNLCRAVDAMLTMAEQATEGALRSIRKDLHRLRKKMLTLVDSDLATDVLDDPQSLVLTCTDCGEVEDFPTPDAFECRRVHDWSMGGPATFCPECLYKHHDQQEEAV